MINTFLAIVSQPKLTVGFEYGDLAALHPTENYSELKTRRKANWANFVSACATGDVSLAAKRLEMYQETSDKITVGTNLIIRGSAQVILYPFVPRLATTYTFDIGYGKNFSIKNTTIKLAQRRNLFESYQCVLKKGADAKKIEILGTTRSDFWTSLSVNQTIFYSWQQSSLGETNTIASFDSNAKTITLNNNISASASNDQSGDQVWFGTDFAETVSESDYVTYGRHWVRGQSSQNGYRLWYCINHSPVASSGSFTTINLENCTIQNFNSNVNISSGNFYINIRGTVNIDYAEVGMSGFARSQKNGQYIGAATKATATGTLQMTGNGLRSVGSIDLLSSGNIYGSGTYIHPTVIVNLKAFHGYNNVASTFRMYSSSIQDNVAYESWIGNFYATGSEELDFRSPNSHAMTIDTYYGEIGLCISGDFTLGSGTIGYIYTTSLSEPPAGLTKTAVINNAIINDACSVSWDDTSADGFTMQFNNCVFNAVPYSESTQFFKNDGGPMKLIEFNNCTYVKPTGSSLGTWTEGATPSGTQAACFIRPYNFQKIVFNNFETDYLIGTLLLNSSPYVYPPNNDFYVQIDDSDIKMSAFFPANYAGTRTFLTDQIRGSRTIVRLPDYSGASYNLPCAISPKVASKNLSITAGPVSLSAAISGGSYSVSNVLVIDMSANEYYVNAGTINHIAFSGTPTDIRSRAAIGAGTITIHAVGGDVVINGWNYSTNPYGNVDQDITIQSGTSHTFTINNKRIFAQSTSSTTPTLATGNGSVKEYKGVLPDYLIDEAGGFTVTAGAITGTVDSNGNIIGTGIDASSFIDYWTSTYYILFDSNLSNGTALQVTYNKFNNWRITGGFEV